MHTAYFFTTGMSAQQQKEQGWGSFFEGCPLRPSSVDAGTVSGSGFQLASGSRGP